MSNRITVFVELEPDGLEFKDDPQAIRIYTDNAVGRRAPPTKTVHSVEEIGPAVQAMVEFNVQNMIANAESELEPVRQRKEQLEKWLRKMGRKP